MIRRPLISTLFPYTTLFRSCIRVREQSVLLDGRDKSVRQRLGGATWAASGKKSTRLRGFPFELHGLQDRKSTRLNSSHRTISYAVFCLKKKTNKQKT